MNRRIIVAADDYGLRGSVEPILALARSGKLDRVAVLAHYVSEEDAKRLGATVVALDVHLELIALLSRGEQEGDHAIVRSWTFFYRYALGFVTRRKARREWRRQIERFRSLFGRLPDGLNSHEHVHFFPPLFQVMTELAHEYGIPYVRCGRRGMLLGHHSSSVGKILAVFGWLDRLVFGRRLAALQTSDHLVSLDWLDDAHETLATLPSDMVEVVCHPEREAERQIVSELKRI
jgi:predicted glycoside hydrolase/deacetylase ChbG (UPF0249 family)